jgi:hypothetical protein
MYPLSPFVHQPHYDRNAQARKSNGAGISINPRDSVLDAIRKALSRWQDDWVTLHSKVSHDEWNSLGFYKNGYSFWLVSQLLITQNHAVDVVMQMSVKCDDKLEELSVLLLDEED